MSVDQAMKSLLEVCTPVARIAPVALGDAARRVLARDIAARRDIPHYNLALVDGFALRAADAGAAGLRLKIAGPGKKGKGYCMQVRTGGAVPAWADAVLRLEDAEAAEGCIVTREAVSAGDAVLRRGATVKKGETAFHAGTRLMPTDAGTPARDSSMRATAYCATR